MQQLEYNSYYPGKKICLDHMTNANTFIYVQSLFLKYHDFDSLDFCTVTILELRPREQLQQGEMRLLHIEDAALLLVNVRAVDDNALQFTEFEGP